MSIGEYKYMPYISKKEYLLQFFRDFIVIATRNPEVRNEFWKYCFDVNGVIYSGHPKRQNKDELVDMIMNDATHSCDALSGVQKRWDL